MALLLDTRDVDPEERRDAVHDAYVRAEVPRQVDLLSQHGVDATRIEGGMFGSAAVLANGGPSGPTRTVRAPCRSPRESPCEVFVSLWW